MKCCTDLDRRGASDLDHVILNLDSHREKELIFQNARKLKGTNISIGEDFSRRVQNIRKDLLESVRGNKQNGDKVVLSFDKLKIKDEIYAWDTEKKNRGFSFPIATRQLPKTMLLPPLSDAP